MIVVTTNPMPGIVTIAVQDGDYVRGFVDMPATVSRAGADVAKGVLVNGMRRRIGAALEPMLAEIDRAFDAAVTA